MGGLSLKDLLREDHWFNQKNTKDGYAAAQVWEPVQIDMPGEYRICWCVDDSWDPVKFLGCRMGSCGVLAKHPVLGCVFFCFFAFKGWS